MPVGRAAVLGRPVGHSLSPVLHRAAYAALGLDWTYEAIDCGKSELRDVLAHRPDWAGFSCTMPLKHVALDVATEVSPRAATVGSANTLLPDPDGTWIADNTDVAGIAETLRPHVQEVSTATVLGAGGTAQAALAALAELGVRSCSLLVRDRSRTEAVLATAERVGVTVTVGDLDIGSVALDAALVISTLPGGAADAVANRGWTPQQTVLDVVYASWPTSLASAATDGGATVLSGALMLLHQAAAQVALMTGRTPPVAAMRAALAAAAPGCGL